MSNGNRRAREVVGDRIARVEPAERMRVVVADVDLKAVAGRAGEIDKAVEQIVCVRAG